MQPRLQSASLLPSPRASINYRFILVPDGPAAYAVEKTIRAVCLMAEIKSQFGDLIYPSARSSGAAVKPFPGK